GGGGRRVQGGELAALGRPVQVGHDQVGGAAPVPGGPVLLVEQVGGVPALVLPLRQRQRVLGRPPPALLGGRRGQLGHVGRGPGVVLVQGLGQVPGGGGVGAGQHVGGADQHLVAGRGGGLGVHRLLDPIAQPPVDLEL